MVTVLYCIYKNPEGDTFGIFVYAGIRCLLRQPALLSSALGKMPNDDTRTAPSFPPLDFNAAGPRHQATDPRPAKPIRP